MYYFYDTCSILLKVDSLFKDDIPFAISSITLEELENIKTAANKDSDIKYAARKIVSLLAENVGKYDIVFYNSNFDEPILKAGLSITNDTKILACAIAYDKESHPDDTVFVTNDLLLSLIANLFFGDDSIVSIRDESDDYCGYLDITPTEQEAIDFFSNQESNVFDLKIGQYLILRFPEVDRIERYCWTGEIHRKINYDVLDSWFGHVKPKDSDVYQGLALDSLKNNNITLLKGPAGSGKSYLALAYLTAQLKKNKIDKIIIFCNTVATMNSARLGFYPGTKDEKLLDSQIGNFLCGKLGDKEAVIQLIEKGQLLLLPMSDIRGYDTTGMRAGIYITEAQNLDITLMKLAIQRIGEDCICIIDGDQRTQVDDLHFAGSNNGMRRLSKIFRDNDIYGEVELKNIYRSKIAKIAELM